MTLLTLVAPGVGLLLMLALQRTEAWLGGDDSGGRSSRLMPHDPRASCECRVGAHASCWTGLAGAARHPDP